MTLIRGSGKMKFKWKNGSTIIDMDKEEKLLVRHSGSIRALEIAVDEFDDICYNARGTLRK